VKSLFHHEATEVHEAGESKAMMNFGFCKLKDINFTKQQNSRFFKTLFQGK